MGGTVATAVAVAAVAVVEMQMAPEGMETAAKLREGR